MSPSITFAYLTDWLVSAIRPEYDKSNTSKWAKYDGKPNKGTIAHLWAMFDKHICEGMDKRLRAADGELYVFNGKWFEKVSEKTFLKELARRVLTELGASNTYRLNAAPVIAKECFDRIANTEECQYKPDRRYICFTNGVFDTKDGKLKPHHIRYCTDIILDFDYNERASCLLWDLKIKEIIPGRDFRKAFQQFCGSLLAKREEMKIEYICYLYGTGSNGKSVVASAVANVFGEQYYSTFTPQQLFRSGDSSMFNMKELQGKILNLCDDLTASDFSGGAFKRLVSGEMQTGRSPYSKEFVKIQPPLMLCCTNAFPETSDDSYGYHRRQLPIFTTRTQWCGNKRDPNLTAKLSTLEARQRIFCWIYEGFRALRAKNGNIELGEAVENAMAELMADSSPVRRWAKDKGFVYAKPEGKTDKRWKSLKEWYSLYCDYATENGYMKPSDSRKIAQMFKENGFESERRIGGWWYCVGVLGVDTQEDGSCTESEIEINNK